RMLLSMEDTRAVSSWYGGQALLLNRARSVEAVVADIEAVTQDDLIRVAGEALRDENLHLAIVGPFETEEPFREALHL
ncbi:MAG: insulinase family protein, partial [Dehalococcoidia bacterium]